MSPDVPRIPAERLAAFVVRVFTAAGVPAPDAQTLANLMVKADLRGSDTHGVIRLPLYLRRIRAGGINPKPDIRVVSDRPSAALIDGDNGMGHLVMRRAAELAIEKAKATGSGGVIVGLDSRAVYSNDTKKIPRGSRLYLFSDGIYEFRDRTDHIFGLEAFIAVLSSRVAATAQGVSALDGVFREIQALSAKTRFLDDVSLVEFDFG